MNMKRILGLFLALFLALPLIAEGREIRSTRELLTYPSSLGEDGIYRTQTIILDSKSFGWARFPGGNFDIDGDLGNFGSSPGEYQGQPATGIPVESAGPYSPSVTQRVNTYSDVFTDDADEAFCQCTGLNGGVTQACSVDGDCTSGTCDSIVSQRGESQPLIWKNGTELFLVEVSDYTGCNSATNDLDITGFVPSGSPLSTNSEIVDGEDTFFSPWQLNDRVHYLQEHYELLAQGVAYATTAEHYVPEENLWPGGGFESGCGSLVTDDNGGSTGFATDTVTYDDTASRSSFRGTGCEVLATGLPGMQIGPLPAEKSTTYRIRFWYETHGGQGGSSIVVKDQDGNALSKTISIFSGGRLVHASAGGINQPLFCEGGCVVSIETSTQAGDTGLIVGLGLYPPGAGFILDEGVMYESLDGTRTTSPDVFADRELQPVFAKKWAVGLDWNLETDSRGENESPGFDKALFDALEAVQTAQAADDADDPPHEPYVAGGSTDVDLRLFRGGTKFGRRLGEFVEDYAKPLAAEFPGATAPFQLLWLGINDLVQTSNTATASDAVQEYLRWARLVKQRSQQPVILLEFPTLGGDLSAGESSLGCDDESGTRASCVSVLDSISEQLWDQQWQ